MKLELYVKQTSNCEAMPLTTFKLLSPTWSGESIDLPFGAYARMLQVVGWTDLHFGSPCPVKVVKARRDDQVGYLVYGGNSGVRIMEPTPGVDDHLPSGWGQPIVWVERADDLPDDVRQVVAGANCDRCHKALLESDSPYHLGRDDFVFLCDDCAEDAEVLYGVTMSDVVHEYTDDISE